MSRTLRRLALQALLWAAPLGVLLALVTLLVAAPHFRAGADVPAAGDERAWGAMWTALVLVATGSVVGLVATAAWLARAWRRRHRPTPLEWGRSVANVVLAAAFLWIWLR